MSLERSGPKGRSKTPQPSQEVETVWSFSAQIRGSAVGELNLSLGCYKRKPGGNCWPEWSGTAINADYLAMVTEILSRSPEATLDLVMQCHSTDTRVVRGRYRIEFIAAIDGQNASARISPLEVETEEEERR